MNAGATKSRRRRGKKKTKIPKPEKRKINGSEAIKKGGHVNEENEASEWR